MAGRRANSAPYGRAAPARSASIAPPSTAARSGPSCARVAASTARPQGAANPPGREPGVAVPDEVLVQSRRHTRREAADLRLPQTVGGAERGDDASSDHRAFFTRELADRRPAVPADRGCHSVRGLLGREAHQLELLADQGHGPGRARIRSSSPRRSVSAVSTSERRSSCASTGARREPQPRPGAALQVRP